jgi:hypothetical protein
MSTSSPVAVPDYRAGRPARRLIGSPSQHRLVEALAVLVGYILLAGLLYQTPLAGHANSLAAGLGIQDNFQFVWMLAWPEHAIAHGLGLFHPNLIFVPEGYNLARATAIFTLGVLLAPLTALAGPLVTYNVVMLAMPVLNAGTTYALCRRLGARPGPAFLGGFVFAFAGIVANSELGAPQTGVAWFVVIAVILVVDLVDPTRQPRWRTAIWLGLDLAAQLYHSSEMATTFLLFGVLALVVTWFMDSARRAAIRAAMPKLAVAAAILAVAAVPYVLAFAFDRGTGLSHANPDLYPADLLAFVIPTGLYRLGREYFSSLSATFPGESGEAYLGVGMALIVVWYLAERWRRSAGARILGVMLAVIGVCSLGTHLTIAGHTTLPLPWALVRHLPLLRYVIPSRLTLYVALGAAVALALWLNRRPGLLRWAVALASCALLIPNPALRWSTSLHTPAFFTSGAAAREFTPRDRVMVVPLVGPDDAAQAQSGFAFALAGGYLGEYPRSYGRYPAASYLAHGVAPPGAPAAVAQLVRAKGVDAVVVNPSFPGPWRQLLSGLGVKPVAQQGALIYRLRR